MDDFVERLKIFDKGRLMVNFELLRAENIAPFIIPAGKRIVGLEAVSLNTREKTMITVEAGEQLELVAMSSEVDCECHATFLLRRKEEVFSIIWGIDYAHIMMGVSWVRLMETLMTRTEDEPQPSENYGEWS